MKDFEVITLEDLRVVWDLNFIVMRDGLNKLINGKYPKGHTHLGNYPKTVCTHIFSGDPSSYDTHEALVILREIEPEVVKCAMHHPTYKKAARDLLPGHLNIKVDCPRCGKNLEGVENV